MRFLLSVDICGTEVFTDVFFSVNLHCITADVTADSRAQQEVNYDLRTLLQRFSGDKGALYRSKVLCPYINWTSFCRTFDVW